MLFTPEDLPQACRKISFMQDSVNLGDASEAQHTALHDEADKSRPQSVHLRYEHGPLRGTGCVSRSVGHSVFMEIEICPIPRDVSGTCSAFLMATADTPPKVKPTYGIPIASHRRLA